MRKANRLKFFFHFLIEPIISISGHVLLLGEPSFGIRVRACTKNYLQRIPKTASFSDQLIDLRSSGKRPPVNENTLGLLRGDEITCCLEQHSHAKIVLWRGVFDQRWRKKCRTDHVFVQDNAAKFLSECAGQRTLSRCGQASHGDE